MVTSVTATTYPSARNDANESKLETWATSYGLDGIIWSAGNQLALFADSTGMQVKLPSGSARLGGVRGDLAAQTTLTIAAADASNPRIDTVVAQLARTPSPYTITFAVITGTAASSPVAPTLPNNATYITIPIGDVRVDATVSTIAANKVTLRRSFSGDTGWQTYVPTLSLVSGSTMSFVSQSLDFARFRKQGMTIQVATSYQVALTTPISSSDGLLLTLPQAAAFTGLPISCYAMADLYRCHTSNGSGSLTVFVDIYPQLGNLFPGDGVARGVAVNGSYEIAPF